MVECHFVWPELLAAACTEETECHLKDSVNGHDYLPCLSSTIPSPAEAIINSMLLCVSTDIFLGTNKAKCIFIWLTLRGRWYTHNPCLFSPNEEHHTGFSILIFTFPHVIIPYIRAHNGSIRCEYNSFVFVWLGRVKCLAAFPCVCALVYICL